MMKIAVVALGGNALQKRGETITIASQRKVVDEAFETITALQFYC